MKISLIISALSIFPLFLFNCTADYILPDDGNSTKEIPVSFSAVSNFQGSTNDYTSDYTKTADINNPISVSFEQEAWDGEVIYGTRTIWGNASNSVTWATGDPIGIYMRYSSGIRTTSNNVRYNVTNAATTSPLTPNANMIVFPYPVAQSNMKFYAYYPYAGVSSTTSPIIFPNSAAMDTLLLNYSLPADQSAIATLRSCDIMYATAGPINGGSSSNVTLPFSHKMTLVTIRVKVTPLLPLLSHTLSKVTLSGTAVTRSGTLNLGTSALTPNTSSTFTPSVTTSQLFNVSTTASVDLIINPCTITNNNGSQFSVKVECSDLLGFTRTVIDLMSSGTTTLAAGVRNIFTISVAI